MHCLFAVISSLLIFNVLLIDKFSLFIGHCFLGGGSRSARRKPQKFGKQTGNFSQYRLRSNAHVKCGYRTNNVNDGRLVVT